MQKREKRRITKEEEEMPRKFEEDTENIYDDEQRERMLEEDEITWAEAAFMEGREKRPWKRKYKPHTDTKSVELAEEEYFED
ncbi:MAG: hypothetical protein ACETWM_08435 [Candidatus Lokiarchaeia archaeon]